MNIKFEKTGPVGYDVCDRTSNGVLGHVSKIYHATYGECWVAYLWQPQPVTDALFQGYSSTRKAAAQMIWDNRPVLCN